MTLSMEDVRGLSAAERAELSTILRTGFDPFEAPDESAAPALRRRRAVLMGIAGMGVAILLVWIVVLSMTLPSTSTAHAWRVAWIGLDVGELAGLAVTGWAAWRRRRLVIPAAVVTATLLVCDAWFDVVLSWASSDWLDSVLLAAFVELPVAALLFAAAYRIVHATSR
jgi:hypothetical protein